MCLRAATELLFCRSAAFCRLTQPKRQHVYVVFIARGPAQRPQGADHAEGERDGTASGKGRLAIQIVANGIGRHRRAEQVALHDVAAKVAQFGHLVPLFDALGDQP